MGNACGGSRSVTPAGARAAVEGEGRGRADSLVGEALPDVVVGETLKKSGVPGILALMKTKEKDAEYLMWCCDALSGLCAGNDKNRTEVYKLGGIETILAAMKKFKWDAGLQAKGCWALAGVAAGYAKEVGDAGGTEGVVDGMKSCGDDYQMQLAGTRALTILTVIPENMAAAKREGAEAVVADALMKNPADGQLQWKGANLLRLMKEDKTPGSEFKESDTGAKRRWNALKKVVLDGEARDLANAQVPGRFGVSKIVADAAAQGVLGVVALMKTRPDRAELQWWCCDAIASLSAGNQVNQTKAYENQAVSSILSACKKFQWDEQVQSKACWALTNIAASHAVEIGMKGGVEVVLQGMKACDKDYQVTVNGIRCLAVLIAEEPNLKRAKANDAAGVVRAAMANNPEDHALQWRAGNLLKQLGEAESKPVHADAHDVAEKAVDTLIKTKSFVVAK